MMRDVQALQEERRGYVIRNLPDRVALVDAELAALGFAVADDVETTNAAPPKRTRQRRKADD